MIRVQHTQVQVFQDGADFYVTEMDECEATHTATAPFKVLDSDMEAATKAREWFVSVYAPANKYQLHWEA